MKEVRKLKQLQTQLSTNRADAEAMKIELANKQREYNQKLAAVKRLSEEIAKLDKNETLKVSEHAIVRYFERVKGFDIGEIQKEILSEHLVKLVDTLGGNGTYPSNNFSVVLRDFTVTTVI